MQASEAHSIWSQSESVPAGREYNVAMHTNVLWALYASQFLRHVNS